MDLRPSGSGASGAGAGGSGEPAAVVLGALALVGVPFRLHGRDPTEGLDCIGVLAASLTAAGWAGVVPSGYALRGGEAAAVAGRFDAMFERGDGAAGDLLLFRVGPGQLHAAVRVPDGIVHADAGLRRVVMRPGAPGWPLIGTWRYVGRG